MGKFIDFLEAAGSPIASIIQSVVNASMQHATNKHNEKLVDKQNAAAALEAEKAYRRSLPTQQIANMRAAGISDFASAQAISGGGTYNPAPVNTAKAEAPQIDLSSAMESVLNAQRLKQEERLQNKLLKAQKEENAANREAQKELKQMEIDATAIEGEKTREQDWQKHMQELQYKNDDLEFRKSQYEYSKNLIDAQVDLTNAQKDDIKAKLEEWKSEPARDARKAQMQLQTMADLFNYRITQRDFNRFLDMYFDRDENGNYQLRTDNNFMQSMTRFSGRAEQFWANMFNILPVNIIMDAITRIFG